MGYENLYKVKILILILDKEIILIFYFFQSLSGLPCASVLIDPVKIMIPSISPQIAEAAEVIPHVKNPANPRHN